MVSNCPLLQMITEGCPGGDTTLPPHFPSGELVSRDWEIEGYDSPAPCLCGPQPLWCTVQSQDGLILLKWHLCQAVPQPIPVFLIPPQFPPRSPHSISYLLKVLHLSLCFYRIQTKTCAIEEAQERPCLAFGSGKRAWKVRWDLSMLDMIVHSTNTYWQSSFYELGTLPGLGDTAANMVKSCYHWHLHSTGEGRKQENSDGQLDNEVSSIVKIKHVN